jgi:hypothetical protein
MQESAMLRPVVISVTFCGKRLRAGFRAQRYFMARAFKLLTAGFGKAHAFLVEGKTLLQRQGACFQQRHDLLQAGEPRVECVRGVLLSPGATRFSWLLLAISGAGSTAVPSA